MIRGSVSQHLEALVTVDVEDGNGESRSLEVILDTGFTGYLVLPLATIRQLGLAFSGRRAVILASGERSAVDAYSGVVPWHGRRRNVIALESSSEFLLGLSLLSGSRVTLDVRAGGSVLVEDARS